MLCNFLCRRSSLPVQWTGFSDPQTGLREFWRCVGLTPGSCDVISPVNTMLSREAHWAGLSLPVATPLYVTVRARNPAGLDTVSVSGSFVGMFCIRRACNTFILFPFNIVILISFSFSCCFSLLIRRRVDGLFPFNVLALINILLIVVIFETIVSLH